MTPKENQLNSVIVDLKKEIEELKSYIEYLESGKKDQPKENKMTLNKFLNFWK